jgi:hypothetical protein
LSHIDEKIDELVRWCFEAEQRFTPLIGRDLSSTPEKCRMAVIELVRSLASLGFGNLVSEIDPYHYLNPQKAVGLFAKWRVTLTQVRNREDEKQPGTSKVSSEITAPAVNDGSRADSAKKKPVKWPDNQRVRNLCKILAERNPGDSQIELARQLTGEEAGNDSKAQSLLRQARRYRHLWDADT